MLDIVGKPIIPGCTVAYPVRKGSKMWMSVVSVTRILDEGGLIGLNKAGRHTRIKSVRNCVVV